MQTNNNPEQMNPVWMDSLVVVVVVEALASSRRKIVCCCVGYAFEILLNF
jgi:hypothetical protein